MMIASYDQKRGQDGLVDIRDFPAKLLAKEGPAIVGAILKARKRYDEEGLIFHPRWKQATDEYFAEIDTKGIWLFERVLFQRGLTASTAHCYGDYEQWYTESGYRGQIGSVHAFIRALKSHPEFRKHAVIHKREWVDGKLVHVFQGLGLRDNLSLTAANRF